jgi:predicted dehydrogenase
MNARVGVVGCGIIAKAYVEGSAAFDSFEVVACADLDADCAAVFADVHGLRM